MDRGDPNRTAATDEIARLRSRQFGFYTEVTLAVGLVVLAMAAIRGVSTVLSEFSALPYQLYLSYLVGGAGVSYLYLTFRSLATEHFAVRRPTLEDGRVLCGLLVAFVGLLSLGVGVARFALGAPLTEFSGHFIARRTPFEVVAELFVGTALFVAPAREALFRGAVQGTLREASTERIAIVGTTVLYVGYHAYFLGANSGVYGTTLFLAVLAVASLALGIAKERTGSILVAVAGGSLLETGLFGLAYLRVL